MTAIHWLLGAGVAGPVFYGLGALSSGRAAAVSTVPGHEPGTSGPQAHTRGGSFNLPMFIAGLLTLAFASGVWGYLECPLAGLGLEVFGLCTMARGAFPSNPPCSADAGDCGDTIHEASARLGILAVGFACLAIARTLWGTPEDTLLAGYSLATGVAVLALLMVLTPPVRAPGQGILRRVPACGIYLWMAVIAIALLLRVG